MRARVRKFSDNLNLVPYIDLFSTLILFLLITAVFDQMSSLPTNMGLLDKGSAAAPQKNVKKIDSILKVELREREILMSEGGRVIRVPMPGDDQGFQVVSDFMRDMRVKYPDKKDVVIEPSDNVTYNQMIQVLDRCLEHDFEELVLAGAEG